MLDLPGSVSILSAAAAMVSGASRYWIAVECERAQTTGDINNASGRNLGYAASKAAVNMLTVQLACELRGTAIKVNAACPGYTATDLNHHRGTQTIPEGAVEIIRLALLADDGPSGALSNSSGSVPW